MCSAFEPLSLFAWHVSLRIRITPVMYLYYPLKIENFRSHFNWVSYYYAWSQTFDSPLYHLANVFRRAYYADSSR